MSRNQWILIGFCLLLTTGLYFLGNTKTIVDPSQSPTEVGATDSFSFIDSIGLYKDDIPAESLALIESLEKELARNDLSKEERKNAIQGIAKTWEKEQVLPVSSYYFWKYAQLENTFEAYKDASNRYFLAFEMTKEPQWRAYFVDQSINCIEKTLNFVPHDLESKIQLAKCYIDGKNQVMEGVLLLREVTDSDSTNIPANTTLGRLSIISGQFNKAEARFRRVLRSEPENTEALYFLGETLVALDKKTEALEVFQKCRALVKNERFRRELDEYLKTIVEQ